MSRGSLGLSWQRSELWRQSDNRHKECFQAEANEDQKRKRPSKHKSHISSTSRGGRTATPKKKNEEREMLRNLPSRGLSQQRKENKTTLEIPESQTDTEAAFLLARLQDPLPIFVLSFVCALKPKFPFLPQASSPLSPPNDSPEILLGPFPPNKSQAHKDTRHVERQRIQRKDRLPPRS